MQTISQHLNESNGPSEEEIKQSIEQARKEAQTKMEKIRHYANFKDAGNGWLVSKIPQRNGMNGKLSYTFIKPFNKLVEVSFKDKWGRPQFGFAYMLRFEQGFTTINKKDINKYCMSFDVVAAQTGGRFFQNKVSVGNYGRTQTKPYDVWFKKNGIDITPPDADNETKFPKSEANKEIVALLDEKERLNKEIHKGWETNKEAQARNKPRIEQIDKLVKELENKHYK